MRELQLWESDVGLSGTFDDIHTLVHHCYFRDCRHIDEPRCDVKEAIESGVLAKERFENAKGIGLFGKKD